MTNTQSFLLKTMMALVAVVVAIVIAGCEPEWVRDQYQRCWDMGGTGAYSRVTFVFTCWKRTEPPSHSKKLYESRYKMSTRTPGAPP